MPLFDTSMILTSCNKFRNTVILAIFLVCYYTDVDFRRRYFLWISQFLKNRVTNGNIHLTKSKKHGETFNDLHSTRNMSEIFDVNKY